MVAKVLYSSVAQVLGSSPVQNLSFFRFLLVSQECQNVQPGAIANYLYSFSCCNPVKSENMEK